MSYLSYLETKILVIRMGDKTECLPMQQFFMGIRGERDTSKTNRRWNYNVKTCSKNRYRKFKPNLKLHKWGNRVK